MYSALVVEDSRTQAVALTRILREAGWGATAVHDGAQALQELEGGGFDIVITDVQMPVMGGYELCRAIKASPGTAGLPVMLLTTLDEPDDVLRGLECGADNFVTKPYEADLLMKRVTRLIDRGPLSNGSGAGSMGARFELFGKQVELQLRQAHVLDYLASTFEDFVRTRERERRVRAESKVLRESERFLQSTLDALSAAIVIVEGSGRVVAVNRAWSAIQTEHPIVGDPVGLGSNLLDHCEEAKGVVVGTNALLRVTREALRGVEHGRAIESEHRPQDGPGACFRVRVSRLGDSSGLRAVLAFEDITDLKEAERRLQHDAHHDHLTGLPNRALFSERLSRSFAAARRGGPAFAVLFLDVDRFKVVNDSLGHEAGDKMLISVAGRISETIRVNDTAARLGGDEFAVLLTGLPDDRFVIYIADRLQLALARPLPTGDGGEVVSSVSIGIALYSAAYSAPEELLRDADTAMYRAKEEGRGRFCVFDVAMHARAMEQLRIETELRRAVERDELVLHYQPVVEVASRRVVALEALVRWNHPERGLTFPGSFISVAEDSGLIGDLGKWVVRDVCEQIARWRDSATVVPITVNVNLSGRQLGGESLAAWIAGVVQETGIDAGLLNFELTESALLDSRAEVTAAIEDLQRLGGGLSMDDFGTGFSSLTALRKHPFDSLKTDRSFVGTMERDPQNAEIVRALVSLAHGLGMTVVAEGVELREHFVALQQLGCDRAQGWLFAKALPVEAVTPLIGASLDLP